MKGRKRVSRQTKKRIQSLREEMNRLPEYVLQEIRAHPTDAEMIFTVEADTGNFKEHEMSIRW